MADPKVISEDNFKLPSFKQEFLHTFGPKLKEGIHQKMKESNGEDIDIVEMLKPRFALEDPYTTDLGFDQHNMAFFIEADVKKHSYKNDGDTVYFDFNSIKDGNKPFVINGREYQSFKEYVVRNLGNSNIFWSQLEQEHWNCGMRFLGLDTPETVKKNDIEYSIREDEDTIITKKLSELDNGHYIYEKYKEGRTENDEVDFIKKGDKYCELIRTSYTEIVEGSGRYEGKIVIEDKTTSKANRDAGKMTQAAVARMIQSSHKAIIALDMNAITRFGGKFPSSFDGSEQSYINAVIKDIDRYIFPNKYYNDVGINAYGKDGYGRFLGTIFLLVDGETLDENDKELAGEKVWINLSKYAITVSDQVNIYNNYEFSPIYRYLGNFTTNDVFRLHEYGLYDGKYIDAIVDMKKLDDRYVVQGAIYDGLELDSLRDHTVFLGDTMFLVPPISIRCMTRTFAQRQGLLRAKGSATKSMPRSERYVEMHLYFNEEDGINGTPYKTTLPSGEEITYHMNGLRSLISQFKFVPFMPIENTYINEILGIEAVTMDSFTVSTMESYPKCLQATLLLREFDYTTYMPELAVIDYENELDEINRFASTISFETMRWYYQRALIRGEMIKDFPFASEEFQREMFAGKTALVPMRFSDPMIRFYVPNDAQLKESMAAITEYEKRRVYSPVRLSEGTANYAKELGKLFMSVESFFENKTVEGIFNTEGRNLWLQVVSNIQKTTLSTKHAGTMLTFLSEKVTDKPMTKDEFLVKHVRPFIQSIKNEMTTSANTYKSKIVTAIRTNEEFDRKNNTLLIGFHFDLILPPNDFDDFKMAASKLTTYSYRNMLKDNVASIYVSIPFYEDDNGKKVVDCNKGVKMYKDSPDYRLIHFCAANYGMISSDLDGYDRERESAPSFDDIYERKQYIDYERFDSLVFDYYDLDDILVKDIAISLSNTFSNHTLNSKDGHAPQFMGSQDAVIEVNIITENEVAAAKLNDLPRYCASTVRDFRRVLKAWPLRIDCELTKMFGISEVTIESVDIDTVPNYPGVYNIRLRMISLDRTLRNKEKLNKLQTGIEGGVASDGTKGSLEITNFAKFQRALQKIEAYPDLELPSISELTKHGFKFLRYMNDSLYPDPDFYFIYSHVLMSEMLSESLIRYFDGEIGQSETVCKDNDGGVCILRPKEGGIEIESNERVKQMQDDFRKHIDAYESAKEQMKDFNPHIVDKYDYLYKYNTGKTWNISDKIIVHFNEEHLLNENTSDVVTASSAINSAIAMIDGILAKPIKYRYPDMFVDLSGTIKPSTHISNMKTNLIPSKTTIDDKFISSGLLDKGIEYGAEYAYLKIIRPVLKELKIDSFFNDEYVEALFHAAARATTAEDAYQTLLVDIVNSNRARFKDKNSNMPLCYMADATPGCADVEQAPDMEKAMTYGKTFGPFLVNPSDDPYYKRLGINDEEMKEYKIGSMMNIRYTCEAFARKVLVTLRDLLGERVLPSIYTIVDSELHKNQKANDILNNDLLKTVPLISAISGLYNMMNEQSKTDGEKQLDAIVEGLEDNQKSYSRGVMFTAVLLSCLTKNSALSAYVKAGDVDSLNAYTRHVCSSVSPYDRYTDDGKMYKFLCSLDKDDLVKNIAQPGQENRPSLNDAIDSYILEKIYVSASNDPNQYLMHSFYDMIMNDKRGRMCRAFPTYYMCLIDEGQRHGIWKLQDNFFSTSAISEVQIVKSRKSPADTAIVHMNNMFRTYTDEDKDIKYGYQYDWRDAFTMYVNPRLYFLKEESNRENRIPVDQVKIVPGVRSHIRIGYGSDLSKLPTLFNGTVAEVSNGDLITLVMQSDGGELLNPLNIKLDGEDVERIDNNSLTRGIANWWQRGATPKTIVTSIMTAKGGWLKEKMYNLSGGYLVNENPYGIVHFGDPKYKTIFENSEIIQNIYEASLNPIWGVEGSEISEDLVMDEPPLISTKVYGKTMWDILHICKSTSPDYRVGIFPFGLRSSVFLGAPRFYAAYDYDELTKQEKRKPFQQYHIYTSFTDIIANNISANELGVKTCAVGLYNFHGGLFTKTQKEVGPIWLDYSIYPEKQKFITVDTQLEAKGAPIIGAIPGVSAFADIVRDDAHSDRKIAWRMTTSILQDNVREMYQGSMLVLGDPSVKPHDRMYIQDVYEGITGCCEVREVVHTLSATDGFVTDITPDVIVSVDDRIELANQSMTGDIVSKALIVALSVCATELAKWKLKPGVITKAEQLKNFAKETNENNKTIKRMKESDWYKKTTKAVKKHEKVVGKLKKIKVKPIPNPYIIAAEIALFAFVVPTVFNMVEEKLKSLKALQVFPLKKHGAVMTAGLNGNQGTVYGSPTWDNPGNLVNTLSKLMLDTPDSNPAMSILRSVFVSEEMKATLNKYNKKELISSNESIDSNFEHSVNSMNMLEAYSMTQSVRYIDYLTQKNLPRVELAKSEIVRNEQVRSLETLRRTSNDYMLISDSEIIKNATQSGLVKILHYEPITDGLEGKIYENLSFNGRVKSVPALKQGDSYNFPLLRKDALVVLESIVVRYCNRAKNLVQETGKPCLYINSGLKVNGEDSVTPVGLSFELQTQNSTIDDDVRAVRGELEYIQFDLGDPSKAIITVPTTR